jgi:hypothetical protein
VVKEPSYGNYTWLSNTTLGTLMMDGWTKQAQKRNEHENENEIDFDNAKQTR